MKQRLQGLQGLIAGVLVGATLTGGVVFATTGTKTIDVLYNNIKVYKDNVLCELKDANGTVIEPFIYNGTTYMPVRGTANLADMEVTWDGATQSVYLWDELVADGTYLMDVCPPYDASFTYKAYFSDDGNHFSMSGEKYSNGFTIQGEGLGGDTHYILINLNGKYSAADMYVGHLDDAYLFDSVATFYVDGKEVEELKINAMDLPQRVSIPLDYGLQLKIAVVCAKEGTSTKCGFGNITVR